MNLENMKTKNENILKPRRKIFCAESKCIQAKTNVTLYAC